MCVWCVPMDNIKSTAMDLIHHVRSNNAIRADMAESELMSMGVSIATCRRIEDMAISNKHCVNILSVVNLY